jgi:hypothetical protein
LNRSPAFAWFVTPGFPVDQLRDNLKARLKIEVERGLVLENDFYGVVVGLV